MSTTSLAPQISVVNEFCKIQISKFAVNLGLDIGTPLKLRLLPPKSVPEEVRVMRGLAFREKTKGKIINNAKHGVIYPITRHPKLPLDVKIQKNGKDGIGLISDHRGFEEHYNKGYNAYAAINDIPEDRIDKSTGSDDDVVACRALFYECDDISIPAQINKLTEFEQLLGRDATMVVQTHKSLHCYFTLEAPCSKEEWTYFQQRLIQKMGSDPSLWNPARIMRLPGLPYRKFEDGDIKEVGLVEIVKESGNRFTLAELNGVLPEWDRSRWEQKIKQHNRQAGRSSLKGQIELPLPENMLPFDMRLLAPYLPYYVEGGRQGWDTARCPVHALEGDHSGDSLHVNRETGAYVCHAGCSRQEIWKATQVIALTAGYTPKQPKKWQSLPFEPDYICDSRYFPTDIPRPTQKLVIIAGAVGLGKSHLVQSWLKKSKTKVVEAILPRVTLERDAANKYGLKAKNDLDLWKPHDTNVSYCINSVGVAQGIPSVVIIDEVAQVCFDAFTSATMKLRRSEVLLGHYNKTVKLIATGGQLIILDAHINSPLVQMYMDSLGLKREDVYLIQNTHPGQVRTHFTSSAPDDKELLLKHWREDAIAGKRLFFASDSCDLVTAEHRVLLSRGIDAKAMLLITRETSDRNPEVKEFISNPDAYLKAHPDVRIILASPSLQSGVSITEGGVEQGYAVYTGVYNPRLMVQQMARYRPPMDWDVWIPKFAHSNKYRSTDPDELLRDWNSKAEDALTLLDIKHAIARGQRLHQRVEYLSNHPYLRCAAELIAQDNVEKINLAQEFKSLLEHSGQIWVAKSWTMADEDKKDAKALRKERKDTRKAQKQQAIDDILTLPLLDESECAAIRRKQQEGQRITTQEYHQLQRTEIEDLIEHLPEVERDEARKTAAKAIIQEDGKAKLRRLWQLLGDANRLQESSRHHILTAFEAPFPWLPELDFSAAQLGFYTTSGVFDLVIHAMEGKPLSHESDVVKRVMAFIPANRDECRKYLNDKIGNTKLKDQTQCMKVIQKVLEVFGVPLTAPTKARGSTAQLWVLDDKKMRQPWKDVLFNEFNINSRLSLKAQAAKGTPPAKHSVGFFKVNPFLPFKSTTSEHGFDYRDFEGKETEFFYDGSLYYIWDSRLGKYLSLDPTYMTFK